MKNKLVALILAMCAVMSLLTGCGVAASASAAEPAASAQTDEKEISGLIPPSFDEMLEKAKASEDASKCGMFLTANGVVRETSRATVREGKTDDGAVIGMHFKANRAKIDAAIEATREMEGIYYIDVWNNDGYLAVGDTILLIVVGGDTRDHTVAGLEYLLNDIKSECVKEQEIFQ